MRNLPAQTRKHLARFDEPTIYGEMLLPVFAAIAPEPAFGILIRLAAFIEIRDQEAQQLVNGRAAPCYLHFEENPSPKDVQKGRP